MIQIRPLEFLTVSLLIGVCQFRMVWHRDGNGGTGKMFLHNDMAAPTSDFNEAVFRQNSKDFFP
jgi:hypothetical protein